MPYSKKLSREKTFANFVVLWLFMKVVSAKFWGVASFGAAKQAIRESLLRKFVVFTNSRKFSPSKVSRYTVCHVAKLQVSPGTTTVPENPPLTFSTVQLYVPTMSLQPTVGSKVSTVW